MICPIHQKPMKESEWGHYCTVMVGVGMPGANVKGYCSYKPPRPKPAHALAPATALLPENRPVGAHPKAVALEWSGRIFAGSNDPQAAILAADVALAWLKGPA